MPYAPGIEYRGDVHLFRGIADAGQGLAAGIQRYRQDRDASRAADTAYETLIGLAGPTLISGLAQEGEEGVKLDDLAKFSGLSLSQKQAKLGQLGVMLQLARSREQEKAQNERLDRQLTSADTRHAEEMKWRSDQAAAAEGRHKEDMDWRKAQVEVARGKLLLEQEQELQKLAQAQGLSRDVADYFATPETIRRPADQALPEIAARHGAIKADWLADLAKPQWRPEMVELGGRQVGLTSPNSAQVLTDPKPDAVAPPNYDWVYTSDPAVFEAGVRNLPPEELKAVLQRRNDFLRASGRETDPLKVLIAEIAGRRLGVQPAAAPAGQIFDYDPKARSLIR